MTESEKIERIMKVAEINAKFNKILRRATVKWMKGIESEIKLQYSDIRKIKDIIIALAKKVELPGMEITEETEDYDDRGYYPTNEGDLKTIKRELNGREWDYYI